jgi:hypothetical protein
MVEGLVLGQGQNFLGSSFLFCVVHLSWCTFAAAVAGVFFRGKRRAGGDGFD